jgi:hypothetical protein
MAVTAGTPNKESGQTRTNTKVGYVIGALSPPPPDNGGGTTVQTDTVIIVVNGFPGDGNVSGLRIFCVETGNHETSLCSPVPFKHTKAGTYTYRSEAGNGTACSTSISHSYSAGTQTSPGSPHVVQVSR